LRRIALSLAAPLALVAACATGAPERRPAPAAKPAAAAASPKAPKAAPQGAPAKPGPPAPAKPAAAEGPATRLLRELAQAAAPDLKRALEREAPALSARPFRTPGGVEGSLPARKAPAVKAEDGFETVTADIGGTQPLSCFLYDDRIDAAGSYQAMLASMVEETGIEPLAAELADVAVVNGSPLLLFHVVYKGAPDGKQGTGVLKLAILPHDVSSFACVHDEPGFTGTFRRATAALAGGLRRGKARPPRDGAAFAELQLARIQGRAAGFQEQRIERQPDGTRRLVVVATQLFNRSPTDLVGGDNQDVTVAAADGTLVSHVSVEVEDGEVSEQLELERDGKTLSYAYSGTISGKRLEGRFEAARPLATDLLLARRFARRAGNVPPAAERQLEWIPSVDPRSATEVVYRSHPARPGAIVAELGAFKIDGRLDADGWLERSEVNLGPFVLVQERVWSRGAP
jgi:hypothetical protein